jgi:hypothetical protein
MSKQYVFILLIGIFWAIQNVNAAVSIIDTKDYFPLETPHGYLETEGQYKWHTEFLGLKTVNDKSYYINTTFISYKNSAEQLADKSLYIIDEAGDIYRAGNFLTNYFIKWYQFPELILKGKMEARKEYTIQDTTVNDRHTIVTLTLQRLKELKLKNINLSCIVIEKHTHVDSPGSWNSQTTYSYEYKYYAKGIGLVKHEGSCYGCSCGNLAPSGGKVLFEATESH